MKAAIKTMTAADIDRFWSKVDMRGADECWPWLGGKHSSRDNSAYGAFNLNGDAVNAHQISAFLAFGWPPDSKPFTLHTCDYPPCCNFNHLFYGTNDDNMKDAARKGRCTGSGRGTHNVQAKLTADQVREIRASSLTHRKLAAIYKIAAPNIHMIKSGKSYKDVI